MDHFEVALQDTGLYSNEGIREAVASISNEMTGRGYVVFTWPEPELFYVNTTNHYSSNLEISISVPPFGVCKAQRVTELTDSIEMRQTHESYELEAVRHFVSI